MSFALRIVGVAGLVGASEYDGKWIVDHVDGDDGRGETRITSDPHAAKRFASAGDAAEFWRQQSARVPIRSTDGRPNRPLTAFTVEIVEAP